MKWTRALDFSSRDSIICSWQSVKPGVEVDEAFGAYEKRLVDDLRQVLRASKDDSILMVSAGDVYVQFLALPGKEEIHCETVSNKFLPEKSKLSNFAVKQLREFGFTESAGSPNFSRIFVLPGEQDLIALARLTFLILSDIYGVAPDAELQFNLTLD